MLNTLLKIMLCISLIMLIFYIFQMVTDRARALGKEEKQKEILKKSVTGVRLKAGKLLGRVQKHFATMNPKERDKSRLYKYYYTMKTALVAGGLDSYFGVELLFVIIVIASIIIGMFLTSGLHWIFTVLVTVVALVALHTVILFTARSHIFDRVILLMKTEDMLCSSMEQGIVRAVQDNLEYIEPSVKAPFENFLINHLQLRVSVKDCLSALNVEIGPLYNLFCERAYQHYVENDHELINGFRGIIEDNNRRRDRLLVRKNIFDTNMMYYGFMMVASVLFIMLMASLLGGLGAFMASTAGRITTIISICTGAIGFIISQMVYTGGIEK